MNQSKLGERVELPSRETLREIFDYVDGNLHWRIKYSRKVNIGEVAGGHTRLGYHAVRLNGQRYFLHRLVWQWHHGDCPHELDHRDQDPSNNRIENLRPATHQKNMCNRRSKNVYALPSGKFKTQFRGRHVGHFDTYNEARTAYLKARDNYIG